MHPAWVPVALDPGAQARANPRGHRLAQELAGSKGRVEAFARGAVNENDGWSSDPRGVYLWSAAATYSCRSRLLFDRTSGKGRANGGPEVDIRLGAGPGSVS